jgi:hypothetical protein
LQCPTNRRGRSTDSNYQIEYSRNLLFEIGGHMEQVFQALIDRSRVLLDIKGRDHRLADFSAWILNPLCAAIRRCTAAMYETNGAICRAGAQSLCAARRLAVSRT